MPQGPTLLRRPRTHSTESWMGHDWKVENDPSCRPPQGAICLCGCREGLCYRACCLCALLWVSPSCQNAGLLLPREASRAWSGRRCHVHAGEMPRIAFFIGCSKSGQEKGVNKQRLLPVCCFQTDASWKNELSLPLRTSEAPHRAFVSPVSDA